MKYYNNGWLVQDIDGPMLSIKNFNYNGINAFDSYPLLHINDEECRAVSNEQMSKRVEDNLFQPLEFISNSDLLNKYIRLCNSKRVNFRVLFIQSNYDEETCLNKSTGNLKFLGFEYCSIPIDEQIITDLDWCSHLGMFHSKLNSNGLFESYEDVIEFKNAYDKLFNAGIIGDGEFDGYIMKVYEASWG